MDKQNKAKARESAYKLFALCVPLFFIFWLVGIYIYGMTSVDVEKPIEPFALPLAIFLTLVIITLATIRYKTCLKSLSTGQASK